MSKNAVLGSVITALFLGLFTGCLNPFPKGTDVFYNRSYGPNTRNKLDVFLPDERSNETKTVMLIHGGAWIAGDKGGAEMKNLRNHLLEAGYAVTSMNYRYACGDVTKQMEDVHLALEYIRSQSTDWNIGNDKFALIGGSAGGHLALLYGHAYNQEGWVKTVVSNVGPTDLTDSLFHAYASNYNLLWTIEELIGASYEEDSIAFAAASPLFHASNCPSLLLYGQLDDLVPKEQGIAMFDTLVARGIPADTTIPALGNHNVFGPNNVYEDALFDEISIWFETYLN